MYNYYTKTVYVNKGKFMKFKLLLISTMLISSKVMAEETSLRIKAQQL